VLNPKTQEQVVLLDGTLVYGLGRWRAHGSLVNFQSSISKIHQWRIGGKFFQYSCDDCRANRRALVAAEIAGGMRHSGPSVWNGCETHPSNPRLTNQGNPAYAIEWKTYLALRKTKNHFMSRGKRPLDVFQLKQILLTQLSCNTLLDLQVAVMILFAAHGYHREDEFGSLQGPSILWQYSDLKASPRTCCAHY
jgi:hypothetical protein